MIKKFNGWETSINYPGYPGGTRHLGYFKTKEEAAEAYFEANSGIELFKKLSVEGDTSVYISDGVRLFSDGKYRG